MAVLAYCDKHILPAWVEADTVGIVDVRNRCKGYSWSRGRIGDSRPESSRLEGSGPRALRCRGGGGSRGTFFWGSLGDGFREVRGYAYSISVDGEVEPGKTLASGQTVSLL